MVLRTLLGEGAAELVPEEPLAPEQVVLTGIRAFEPGQREYLEQAKISWRGVEDFERVLDGLDGPVYVHVDLDVLDPTERRSMLHVRRTNPPLPGGSFLTLIQCSAYLPL